MSWLILYTIGNKHYIDREGTAVIWKKDAELITFEPGQPLDIRQYITSTQDHLSQLILYVKTTQEISLVCEILDAASGAVVRDGKTVTVPIGSVVPATWTFDPVNGSKNGRYIAHITGQAGSERFSVFTAEPNRFDGGALLIDNTPQETIRLVLDWRHYVQRPWHALVQRLTYAKPGPGNHQAMMLLLTSLLLLASSTTLGVVLSYPGDPPADQAGAGPQKHAGTKNN
ncbi:MAG: hypothetical protein WCT27_01575 [Patescibacteria group bacterium]